jgi:hypothetical protein
MNFSRIEFLIRYHEYLQKNIDQNIDLFSQYGTIGLMTKQKYNFHQ